MKVLLADEHALFREGLYSLLSTRGIDVVGAARDGLEALEMARTLSPDIVIMDIRMPRCDGLTATRLILGQRPGCKVIILTACDDEQHVVHALRSGASAYLLKSVEADTLMRCIQGVMQGEVVILVSHAPTLLQDFAHRISESNGKELPDGCDEPSLTARQAEILELVSLGLSYKEVGCELNLSERTIKYHMAEIIRALRQKNREQAILYARLKGLVRGGRDISAK